MKLLLAMTAALALPAAAGSAATQETPVVEQQAQLSDAEHAEASAILQRFVEDYRNDQMAISGTFGIKLADRFWTVDVKKHERPEKRGRLTDFIIGPHDVTIREGRPSEPTFVYIIANMEVLRLIGTGQVNAGTASMQSFGSDQVGVETGSLRGFDMNSGAMSHYYHHLSHFFTMGTPEITYFGEQNSLETHGAQATALHMMKGVRVLHFSMPPEAIVNEDVRLQKGQMPNLFIITKGSGIGFLGDEEIELKPGMSIFVPQNVRHEIKATGDGPMEGVLVLYGDNSDYAFGTSYPTYLEDFYRYQGEYQFKRDHFAEEKEDGE